MEVIPEQWISALQLLHEDLWKVHMRQVSTPNHLAYMWKVEMIRGDYIKEEEGNRTGGLKKSRKKHCSNLEPDLSPYLRILYKNQSPRTLPRTSFLQFKFVYFLSFFIKPT